MKDLRIAGYCRISVDTELDKDNTSIENQKAIITDYAAQRFPGCPVTFYADRDRSGYTFEQREEYQAMRKLLAAGQYDILMVKDFSRFSRRNSRGLVELEDLRDMGIRIISISDGIDYPNDDDWIKIQFQFLINEMPVTDASKKVKAVIARKQKSGDWLCSAPYGYILNVRREFEIVPEEAEVVREIYRMYLDGAGYRRISNSLTDRCIPTPRMCQRQRKEELGLPSAIKAKPIWSLMTVEGILSNDFYIGTLRTGKYTREKINGKDMRKDEGEHIVFEGHHPAIIERRDFDAVQEMKQRRSTGHYRGQKKYDNTYSGLLRCGDCGSPMFSYSRRDGDGYRCGLYHRRGRKGCTSHHISPTKLDQILKMYVKMVRDNATEYIDEWKAAIEQRHDDMCGAEQRQKKLLNTLAELHEELKAAKRQRIKDAMRRPENTDEINALYDEIEADIERQITGVKSQLEMVTNQRNALLQATQNAKTVLDVFDDIINKPKLEKQDLCQIVDCITVYEDRIDIKLRADIDELLRCSASKLHTALSAHTVQEIRNQPKKHFNINVVNEGDALLTTLTQTQRFAIAIANLRNSFVAM